MKTYKKKGGGNWGTGPNAKENPYLRDHQDTVQSSSLSKKAPCNSEILK